MADQLDLQVLDGTVEGVDGKPVTLAGLAATYSGRVIEERNPKLASLIAVARREGVPAKVIHEATGVHESAIAQIERRAEGPLSLEDHKREVLHRLGQLSVAMMRQMQEWLDAGQVKPAQFQSLAIAMGITLEKKELLSGGATHRTEHVAAAEDEDAHRFFTGLRQQARNASGMVMEAEEVLAKGGGAAAGSDRAAALGSGDSESLDGGAESLDNAGGDA